MDDILQKITKHHKDIFKLEKKLKKIQNSLSLDTYDDNQLQVINSDHNIILVEAFPGAGKTHTILGRLKRFITINPKILQKIIIITFTKKSGEELRDRINKIAPDIKPYFIGTFHGLAYQEIVKSSQNNITLIDQSDQNKIIKDIAIKLIRNRIIHNTLIPIIDKYINLAYQFSSTQYPPNIELFCKKHSLTKYTEDFHTLLNHYQKEKTLLGIIDMNDLMIQFYLLLVNNKLPHLENIDHIFFDEYQDVNQIQNQILKTFVNKGISLMAVGDPRQSIYNFRGSQIKFINDFEKEFKGAKRFILPKNYRSTPNIVNLANHIFTPSLNMITDNIPTTKPIFKTFNDIKMEKKYILDEIQDRKTNGQLYKDITILTRNNKLLTFLEEDLIRRNIPYLKNGGQSLLEKTHIKDLISFLAIFFYPEQKFHWKRIIKLHPNIPIKLLDKILIEQLPQHLLTFQYDKKFTQLFSLHKFYNNISNFKIKDKIYEIIHYINSLNINYNTTIDERDNDYKILSNFINDDKSFSTFINEIYLEKPLVNNDDNDFLEINTFHGSKGLEWDTVFLMGITSSEINYYYSNNLLDEIDTINEEKRLFFVATTRAKKDLYITASLNSPWKKEDNIHPFINEFNNDIISNIKFTNPHKFNEIHLLIKQFLSYKGITQIQSLINNIKYDKISHSKIWDIPTYLQSFHIPFKVSKFFNILTTRIIYDEIDNVQWNTDLTQDLHTNWKDNINNIWLQVEGSTDDNWKLYFDTLTFDQWDDYASQVISLFKHSTYIKLYPKIKYEDFYTSFDIITDKFFIDIKPSFNDNLNLQILLQNIFTWFIIKQHNKSNNIKNKINQIHIFNPITGDTYILHKSKEWLDISKIICQFFYS